MANVSVKHVSKKYAPGKGRDGEALRDFCIEVDDHEFVVLAGPPGCGNTAALRVIAGLEEVSGGDILIGGKRVNGLQPAGRDLAVVFSKHALVPHMSAGENIAFGLRKFPKTEIKRRVSEAAAMLGIEKYLDRKPAALSSAERQRVSVARAVARQPKVFLFDEPLAELDSRMRAEMRAEIIKLHQRLQATIIYATGDQGEAMALGGRAAVMREGVIQQADAPLALYRQPANLFVAGFLGSPPMNFIHGSVRESGGALSFKEARGGVIEIKLGDRPEAMPFAGREVVAGIRPEDIGIVAAAAARSASPRFQSLVEIIEPLGGHAIVHLDTGAHALLCRASSAIADDEAGRRMQFEIDPSRIHLFDPESTRRLAAPPPVPACEC